MTQSELGNLIMKQCSHYGEPSTLRALVPFLLTAAPDAVPFVEAAAEAREEFYRANGIRPCPRHSCASPRCAFRGGVLIFRNRECQYLSIYDSQPSCPSQPLHCRHEGRHRSRARNPRARAGCWPPLGGC